MSYLKIKYYTVYCVVNEEPNAEEMKAKVKEYEEADKAQIVIRQSQRADEERSIADRIAAEKREVERRKREFQEEARAVSLAKRKLRQEATEVMLGEREEVSAELRAAQMQGYRNELRRQQQGRQAALFPEKGPMVREPEGGLVHEKKLDRELYRKRQSAAGGIDSTNLASLERCWLLAENSLFAKMSIVEKNQ